MPHVHTCINNLNLSTKIHLGCAPSAFEPERPLLTSAHTCLAECLTPPLFDPWLPPDEVKVMQAHGIEPAEWVAARRQGVLLVE